MAPADVNTANEKVWRTLYKIPIMSFPKPRFRLGDIVIIYAYKKYFCKRIRRKFYQAKNSCRENFLRRLNDVQDTGHRWRGDRREILPERNDPRTWEKL